MPVYVSKLSMSLPSEIWTRIFDLAGDDTHFLEPGIPTSFAESAWSKVYWKMHLEDGNAASKWRLRSPKEAMGILQRRNYATKKVFLPPFLRSESSDM